MTYEEYIAQQQQAIDEEQQDDSCFLEYQPEGQFVRGHWDMDHLPQNPAILVSSVNMLLRDAERSPIELGEAASA